MNKSYVHTHTHTHSDLSQTQSPADSSSSHLLNLPLPRCLSSFQPAFLPDVTCVNLLARPQRKVTAENSGPYLSTARTLISTMFKQAQVGEKP